MDLLLHERCLPAIAYVRACVQGIPTLHFVDGLVACGIQDANALVRCGLFPLAVDIVLVGSRASLDLVIKARH